MNLSSQPILQSLVNRGLLTADQLSIIDKELRVRDIEIERLLISLGFVSEIVLYEVLAENLGQDSINLELVVPDVSALQLVDRNLAYSCHVLPLSYQADGKVLTIACADPNDLLKMDRIQRALPANTHLQTVVSSDADIEKAIDRYYGHDLSIDSILKEIDHSNNRGNIKHYTGDGDYSQPVVRLIDALLTDAVKQDASDIHFEPESAYIRIRYRIDGFLRQIRVLHRTFWPAMAVRIKVMAGLDIAETRSAQDGHFSMRIGSRYIDFRISTQPVLHGENIVLRILDRNKGIVPLPDLGMSQSNLDSVIQVLTRPEGLILVTGPTGSGKTTTLYSMLNHISHDGINIMTLEDPVEYPLPLIRQTSITENGTITFTNGIRSLMRQDPDVILVGEIRDSDTASMALRAAMTGHLVFSTLHASSAIGVLPRLYDLGIRAPLLAGNLIAIIAQRLLRRLCPKCKEPDSSSLNRYLKDIDFIEKNMIPISVYKSKGCSACDFQGYRGRFVIMEILTADQDFDDLIVSGQGLNSFRKWMSERDINGLVDDGIRHVLAGETSFDELARVVFLDKDKKLS